MFFSFSFVANKKRKKRKRKRATASYALTSVVQMDVASRACTLALAIGATHVNILSASIIEIQNFIFSIQACLKVTFHVRTHVRGANVVQFIKKFSCQKNDQGSQNQRKKIERSKNGKTISNN